MFVQAKDLTHMMDTNICYVLEAKDRHLCTEQEYEAWIGRMYFRLDAQLEKLKQISCDDKLIRRYERKIQQAKEA